ncbi:hypothetical protein [Oleiagrimonas soli]|uniref:Uncharacterized protein n=1 Tax=Oleiagrimonas soli TaxID=1543381 RepID=A0A841KDI1_9GAMM|nr:hypothetical protein [Oleiagrimonas soli]MBB6183252.1 hypothetical protein [Oleiagrimonas soli]
MGAQGQSNVESAWPVIARQCIQEEMPPRGSEAFGDQRIGRAAQTFTQSDHARRALFAVVRNREPDRLVRNVANRGMG